MALDEALKDRFPSANRWDYGIGLPAGKAEQVLWLEVHHAASGETDRVLRKPKPPRWTGCLRSSSGC